MSNRKGPRSSRRERSRGAELLKGWRGDRTQEEVCRLLDIDHGAYCAFETGYRRPGLERAGEIEKGTDGAVPIQAWLEPSQQKPTRKSAA